MTRSRGFVNYDIWILLTLLGIIVAIVVPAVARARQRARLRRTEIAALQHIAAAEAANYTEHHVYIDTLAFPLPGGVTLTSMRADSTGWGAVVGGDSLQPVALSCGIFEGPVSFAPNPGATTPRRFACW